MGNILSSAPTGASLTPAIQAPTPVDSNETSFKSQTNVDLPVDVPNPVSVNPTEMTISANATPAKKLTLLSQEISQMDLQKELSSNSVVERPGHACAYCGVHDPSCVVLCEMTKKWFCNGDWNLPCSHIVAHVTRSKVKRVLRLHPDSPHRDIILKCCKCSCTNVFQLGFCPREPDLTRLLCRTTCSDQSDLSSWKPIVENKRFVSWVVNTPSAEVSPITFNQINRLEELWRKNPQAEMKDLENPTKKTKHIPILPKYSNSRLYRETLLNLLKVEAEYDREQKGSYRLEHVKFRWSNTPNGDHIAYFSLPDPKEGIEIHVRPGEELIISREGRLFGVGLVISSATETSEEIGVVIRNISTEPASSADFTIQFRWKSIPYVRMETAVDRVNEKLVDIVPPFIFHRLLGKNKGESTIDCDLPTNFSAPGLPELNPSQISAVQTVVQQRLSLIQGPPGTGKTMTSATIVYQLNRIYGKPVLAVAPSNIAVDHLCEQIAKTGLKVTRMYSRSTEHMPSLVPARLILHRQIRKMQGYDEFRCLKSRKDELGVLEKPDKERYRTLLRELEYGVLSTADVICCTCITAGDPRLKSFSFHSIVIDEAAQATQPECLVPITLGCHQLVMVGDHCQLGPIIGCLKAAKYGLAQSLFERFILLGIKPIQLRTQYRMHPALSELPNQMFYNGTLQNAVSASDRCREPDFPWPNPNIPVFFYRVPSQDELAANGLSYLNRMEAEVISKFVAKMLTIGVPVKSIGVITGYDGQRGYIMHQLRYHQVLRSSKLKRSLEIASVDGFQGREKDYIILSCVRSNQQKTVGFMSDPRRLNVALTRARYGMIIIGNPETLCAHRPFNTILHYYQDRKLLVEGSIDNLSDHVMNCKRFGKPYVYRQGQHYRVES